MCALLLQAPATNGNTAGAKRQRPNYREASDSDDNVPLKDKILPQRAAAQQGSKRKSESRQDPAHNKKPKTAETRKQSGPKPARKPQGGDKRWTTLHHSGVLFPPEYEVHGIKMLYEGKPVDLTPEQEEVATMFAVMKETDYMKKEQFLRNFWDAFKPILGKGHVIKDLKKCDFSPIYEWRMAEREKLKGLSREASFGRWAHWSILYLEAPAVTHCDEFVKLPALSTGPTAAPDARQWQALHSWAFSKN